MRTRAMRRVTVRYTWDRLRVSFWFAPLVMSAAAILLARAMQWVDLRIPNEMLQDSNLVLSGSIGELRTNPGKHCHHHPGHRRGGIHAAHLAAFDRSGPVRLALAARFPGRSHHPARSGHVCGYVCLLHHGCHFHASARDRAAHRAWRASTHGYAWIALDDGHLCLADLARPAHQHHAPSPQYRGCGGRTVAGRGPCRDAG